MERIKYMRLKLGDLPKSLAQQYKLELKATSDCYVHVEIMRGIYGLLHAGLIAQPLI